MMTVEGAISSVLAGAITEITQRSIFNRMGRLAARPLPELEDGERQAVMSELETSVRLFARANHADLLAACRRALNGEGVPAARQAGRGMIKALDIRAEKDIATARLEAWSEAVRIGLSKFTSVKVATAVSELARNIVFYAGEGQIELRSAVEGASARLEIVARDGGPGIDRAKLDEIYAGSYRSARGMGKGLMAVKKLVDDFQLDTAPGRGTLVTCLFRGDR
ncbi:MAG TPA: ATP-binding protein [Thermoanaerobaculia bacterium]|jgi:serine/threonine-protein kinase RsbT